MTLETTLGLRRKVENAGTVDVAAGISGGVLVVADGMGGHCTGWLGARLAVHAVLDAMSPNAERRVVGAAGALPDDWGWTGDRPRKTYERCASDLGALPHDLGALFREIDRVVADIPTHESFGLLVGCIAATIDGRRIEGAHAGVGRAVVIRAGASEAESLVVEHYWHLVPERVSLAGKEAVGEAPQHVIINGLGQLSLAGVGIDRFEVELRPGDVFIASSRRLEMSDADLARAVARHRRIDDLAREIERQGEADVAFVIAHHPITVWGDGR